MNRVGVVVIGRNEGDRLIACLKSVARVTENIVYVDSGSSDGSPERIRSVGIDVVPLAPDQRFTAARGRNAGFARLRALMPDLAYVQFVDGDCELRPYWLKLATSIMDRTPSLAVICGRRRERHPEASVYNRLCDMEWDTPCGETDACGGDALFRASALAVVGGFDQTLIAGEEPDLCFRLRQRGWKVARVGCDMTVHDAAMIRFGQWWQRNRRSGHATAEALHRRGAEDRRLYKQVLSNLLWSLPVAMPFWPLLWWRIARHRGRLYATFTVLGKLPHSQGQLQFWLRGRRGQGRLIEYK